MITQKRILLLIGTIESLLVLLDIYIYARDRKGWMKAT